MVDLNRCLSCFREFKELLGFEAVQGMRTNWTEMIRSPDICRASKRTLSHRSARHIHNQMIIIIIQLGAPVKDRPTVGFETSAVQDASVRLAS
jgi:hypothetical protein